MKSIGSKSGFERKKKYAVKVDDVSLRENIFFRKTRILYNGNRWEISCASRNRRHLFFSHLKKFFRCFITYSERVNATMKKDNRMMFSFRKENLEEFYRVRDKLGYPLLKIFVYLLLKNQSNIF